MSSEKRLVLVVEDQEQVVMLTRAMLEDKYNLAYVSSMKDALDYLKVILPDVIVLDLNLADSAGFDTLNTMQAAVPSIPIVVYTGDSGLSSECILRGAQEYVDKTKFDYEELQDKILSAYYRHKVRWVFNPMIQAIAGAQSSCQKTLDLVAKLGTKS